MARIALIRFNSNDRCQSASVSSGSERIAVPPTLLTRQSTCPKRVERGRDEPLRLAGHRQVGRDVELTDPVGPPPGCDDVRPLGLQLPRDLEPDPAGRAGDDADLSAEAELHRGATLAA